MTKQEARAVLKKANWRDAIIELVCAHEHCEYCGDPARSETNFWRMTTDHIIPRAGDDPSNLALACASCNSRKRNRLPPDLTRDKLSTMDRGRKVKRIREWLEATKKKSVKPTEQEQFEAFRVLWQE
jgi:5-methylcytosine-specific restriction endonuclease McrA